MTLSRAEKSDHRPALALIQALPPAERAAVIRELHSKRELHAKTLLIRMPSEAMEALAAALASGDAPEAPEASTQQFAAAETPPAGGDTGARALAPKPLREQTL